MLRPDDDGKMGKNAAGGNKRIAPAGKERPD
jgi:hypothetical protein